MNTLSDLRYPIGAHRHRRDLLRLGLMKITAFAGVAGWMAASGVPLPELLLVATIAIEVGAGLLLIIGKQVRLAALALALFLVPVTLVFHGFWSADAASFQDQLTRS